MYDSIPVDDMDFEDIEWQKWLQGLVNSGIYHVHVGESLMMCKFSMLNAFICYRQSWVFAKTWRRLMSSLLGQKILPVINLYNVKKTLVWPNRKFITMFVYHTVNQKSKVKNSVTLKHFQKWPNNQSVILALSPSISLIG